MSSFPVDVELFMSTALFSIDILLINVFSNNSVIRRYALLSREVSTGGLTMDSWMKISQEISLLDLKISQIT